jgi:putative ABC transport system permease protein
MNLLSAREGVLIALESLRSNKVRAALTILGIVIGVATVMAMAAVIVGVRSSITGELEALGPNNFIVERFDQTQLRFVSDGTGRPPWEGKPAITLAEAELIGALESIHSVAASVSANADIRIGSRNISNVSVLGRGWSWPDYTQGDFTTGRNFLPSEERASASVVVLSSGVADVLFPGTDAMGRQVRMGGEPFTVVGVYQQKPNVFSGAQPSWVVVPPTTAIKRLNANENWLSLLVVPAAGTPQQQAMDDVTGALRTARGLRPIDENNFALIRQEAFMELFDRLTGVFFLVMLILSSIGLMVGGVGVVAIMMISVTERTREIGVRKALGATRREILWQFLVESMTVTVIGGALGLMLGGGGALLLALLTPIPASVPLWSIAAALLVSAITGIGFGMIPASKASRLDPVEALRYE